MLLLSWGSAVLRTEDCVGARRPADERRRWWDVRPAGSLVLLEKYMFVQESLALIDSGVRFASILRAVVCLEPTAFSLMTGQYAQSETQYG